MPRRIYSCTYGCAARNGFALTLLPPLIGCGGSVKIAYVLQAKRRVERETQFLLTCAVDDNLFMQTYDMHTYEIVLIEGLAADATDLKQTTTCYKLNL